ncbi:hypothetical protein [Bacillus weihaiensis]|uniref:Uncharacterized protein n=1 Tax=Bacillus weihaiensis TaxID=1547283 RepID=A0A1L3MUI1_9BACI|nr:hypothetical protein [Bacillus weihaiensis]APH05983.1 hypothetical protein A9C19_15255 [Bacillus weihaiensis]
MKVNSLLGKKKVVRKKNRRRLDFVNLIAEILMYLPELILLPFRLLWYVVRGVFRFFDVL